MIDSAIILDSFASRLSKDVECVCQTCNQESSKIIASYEMRLINANVAASRMLAIGTTAAPEPE
jgi:hypothetical protein